MSYRNIRAVTKELGQAYVKWKTGEKEKEAARKAFFDLIDAEATADPEEKLIEIDPALLPVGVMDMDGRVETYVEREHPAWDLDEYRVRDDGWVEAILILKPELKARSYVNPDDGMVYQRQFTNGSPVLDDEALREADPELWVKITEVPNVEHIHDLILEARRDPDEDVSVSAFIDAHWEGPRVLKPLDSLDEETEAAVAPFIHPGKPSVKLAPPRKAKPEELEQLVERES